MTEQRFGRIIVEGNAAQLALAAKVYAGADPSLPFPGDIEPRDFRAEFHTAQEMYDLGAIIPDSKKTPRWPKGQPAYGFTFPTRLCVNGDIRPRDQAYALEHEPFHPIVAANMTAAKAKQLRALVEKVAGGTAYQNRLSEVLCDAFVELFYGHSILDAYYGDIADGELRNAWNDLVGASTDPVIPVDPPAPLPLPDPLQQQVDDLTAQLAQCSAALQALQSERTDALNSIAGKDAALRSIATGATGLAAAATKALA